MVLARLLDDPTFGILNGFIFFNQVDIIQHIQQDERILADLFLKFRQPLDANDSTLDDSKRDSVLFIHQLMIMGKSIQLPSRLHLYRGLLDRGLLFVCEWAFSRSEAKIIHPAAEMLTLAVDHDVTAVRSHVMKEEEIKRQTLIIGMIGIMCSTKNLGLLSQLADILRTLLEMPSAEADVSHRYSSRLTVDLLCQTRTSNDRRFPHLFLRILRLAPLYPLTRLAGPPSRFGSSLQIVPRTIRSASTPRRATFFLRHRPFSSCILFHPLQLDITQSHLTPLPQRQASPAWRTTIRPRMSPHLQPLHASAFCQERLVAPPHCPFGGGIEARQHVELVMHGCPGVDPKGTSSFRGYTNT